MNCIRYFVNMRRAFKAAFLAASTLTLLIAFNNCGRLTSFHNLSPDSDTVKSKTNSLPANAADTYRTSALVNLNDAFYFCGRAIDGIFCYPVNPSSSSMIAGPPLSDANGWSARQYYESITPADIDGDGHTDICARGRDGMLCWLATGDGFSSTSIQGPPLSDANGWASPKYYKTILMADINADGKADICARSRDGIFCWLATGSGFSSTAIQGPPLSDAQGWSAPQYYRSIMMMDLNGDGRADICGRSRDGILCWLATGNGFSSTAIQGPALSDQNGWDLPRYYETISPADINGDGKADICGRSRDGILCWTSTGNGFSSTAIQGPALSDANGWTLPRYYKTVTAADINADGMTDFCGRSRDGILCWLATGSGFSSTPIQGPPLSDTQGWSAPQYYQSLFMADVNADKKADLCGRSRDGILCWTSTGNGFSSNATQGPPLSDLNGWSSPQFGLTIFGSLRLGDSPESREHVYGDYGGAVRETYKRADDLQHIDTAKTISRLKAAHIGTYAFHIRNGHIPDWNDFLEFLPEAQAAGIEVWLYLLPPTEVEVAANYFPYGHEYGEWAMQAAMLSREYPMLTTIVMDDFGLNLSFFTPDYLRSMLNPPRLLAPWLKFNAVNYDISIDPQLSGAEIYNSVPFVTTYNGLIDAVIFPYLHWGDKIKRDEAWGDLRDERDQIDANNAILTGQVSQFVVKNDHQGAVNNIAAGDFAALSELVTNSSGFQGSYPFRFRLAGWDGNNSSGFYQAQILVDGNVVWSLDFESLTEMQYLTLDLGPALAGKTSARITAQVRALKASTATARFSWNIPKGSWVMNSRGGWAGTSQYHPAPEGLSIPLIVMIYDGGFGFNEGNNPPAWRPSEAYLRQANLTAKEALDAGNATGIIQYVMDKDDGSRQLPIIEELYSLWN